MYSTRGKNFLLTILRLATERDELRIVNDQFGAPTWSREIASASVQVLQRILDRKEKSSAWGELSGTYHMTAAGETTWFEFAKAILHAAQTQANAASSWFAAATSGKPLVTRKMVPITTSDYPTPARRPSHSVLSNARLAQMFGIKLADWRTQLHRACADERINLRDKTVTFQRGTPSYKNCRYFLVVDLSRRETIGADSRRDALESAPVEKLRRENPAWKPDTPRFVGERKRHLRGRLQRLLRSSRLRLCGSLVFNQSWPHKARRPSRQLRPRLHSELAQKRRDMELHGADGDDSASMQSLCWRGSITRHPVLPVDEHSEKWGRRSSDLPAATPPRATRGGSPTNFLPAPSPGIQ